MVGVFVSHSSPDKAFARRLGNDLRGHGARVWIDEAEIKVGDSLIDKISDGIQSTEYLAIVLSRASCRSEWVRREVNIALTREIQGRRVTVLPCLLEDCDIPAFLIDKKYADFRPSSDYRVARAALMKALGLDEGDPTQPFLNQHVFYDLIDLNNGFDVASIKYFSAGDFATALKRIQALGVGVLGIEPWPNGEFGGVSTYEGYGGDPFDAEWYNRAFREFRQRGIKSHFAASYEVPKSVLKKFEHASVQVVDGTPNNRLQPTGAPSKAAGTRKAIKRRARG